MRALLVLYIFITTSGWLPAQTNNDNKELLKGDWVSNPFNRARYFDEFTLSFNDSLCFSQFPYRDFIGYSVKDDSILIPRTKTAYKILLLTDDSLILRLISLNGHVPDPIHFSRIKPRNSIIPSKIYFTSSGCYGVCPIMSLEIDSTGKFLFFGERFTTKKGGFSGQLDKKLYEEIVNNIRNLQLDSLQKHYTAPWTDAETLGIAVLTDKKNIITTVYGNNMEPVELRILLHKLKEVYKRVTLKKDASVNKLYFNYLFRQPNISGILSR